jgi:hypothetical protein
VNARCSIKDGSEEQPKVFQREAPCVSGRALLEKLAGTRDSIGAATAGGSQSVVWRSLCKVSKTIGVVVILHHRAVAA